MDTNLAKTPLHDQHVALGAKMVDFSGWSMPIQYGSIVAEHEATRQALGLFDVSHMGRFRFDGPTAGVFLDSLITRRVENLKEGQIRYGLIVNESGGILDDVLAYHLLDHAGSQHFALVVNAGNREKIAAVIRDRLGNADVDFKDLTLETTMIAVQGPRAIEVLNPLVDIDIVGQRYYSGLACHFGGTPIYCSRTGYTGEDGCELVVPAAEAARIWTEILAAGRPFGARPAGLGARDTLRLEAAMPLYGHELTESIDPFQAGLSFAVNLRDRNFLGSEALQGLAAETPARTRVGLQLQGKRVPREGYLIQTTSDSQVVGEITSGTFSPTLQCPIAMAYVDTALVESLQSGAAIPLQVDIRGRLEPAQIVPLPFYQRTKGE